MQATLVRLSNASKCNYRTQMSLLKSQNNKWLRVNQKINSKHQIPIQNLNQQHGPKREDNSKQFSLTR